MKARKECATLCSAFAEQAPLINMVGIMWIPVLMTNYGTEAEFLVFEVDQTSGVVVWCPPCM